MPMLWRWSTRPEATGRLFESNCMSEIEQFALDGLSEVHWGVLSIYVDRLI